MNLPPYKKFLIIQTAFLGDVILLTSLIEKIRFFYPEGSITVLVKKGNAVVFDYHPFVHEVWEMDKNDKSISALWQWIKKIRKEKFDAVINAHRYFRTGLLTAFSGARHTAGYKENPLSFMFHHCGRFRIGDGTHEIERLNSLVEDFLGNEIHKPRLYPTEQDWEIVSAYVRGKEYMCFAPGSVWKTKQWPLVKWIELGKKIKENTICILGSNADDNLGTEIKNALDGYNKEVINLCGKLSLLQSAALMAGAKMNYVNDSAPLHIASAMNAPVTAIFCSTVPEFGFYPLSDKSEIWQVNGLSCRPCGIHGKTECPKGHFKCAEVIFN
ncbi:MAG: glycosyltransferase family 9 protein [Bacteroidia bacterium]|nr:glycosyltransferase family 9 protein [Bacteroidia bacterium]